TARLAPSAEAGRPIRMALAMVAGRSTGWPSTSGAAPAAWNPSIWGRPPPRRAVDRGGPPGALDPEHLGPPLPRLGVAQPGGGDVAGVADRDAVDVGGLAEGLDDLEGDRLLPLGPQRGCRV